MILNFELTCQRLCIALTTFLQFIIWLKYWHLKLVRSVFLLIPQACFVHAQNFFGLGFVQTTGVLPDVLKTTILKRQEWCRICVTYFCLVTKEEIQCSKNFPCYNQGNFLRSSPQTSLDVATRGTLPMFRLFLFYPTSKTPRWRRIRYCAFLLSSVISQQRPVKGKVFHCELHRT